MSTDTQTTRAGGSTGTAGGTSTGAGTPTAAPAGTGTPTAAPSPAHASSAPEPAVDATAAAAAAAYFSARLRFETDPSDVYAAQKRGDAFVLLDVRSGEAWAQGHIEGAIHMPYAEMPQRALAELDLAVPVVVYCWSPGCNAGHKGALALSELGFSVREMLGGYEYWVREGQPATAASGPIPRVFDPLTMVVRAPR